MNVRAASSSDLPSLVRLHRLLHEIHVQAEPRFFRTSSLADSETVLGDALSTNETRAFVAEEAETVVGYLLGAFADRKEDTLFRPRRWFQIDHISVDPEYQRRGHGRRLVKAAIECARAAGVQQVQTGVWAFNEASLSLFRGQGLQPSEHRLRMPFD